MYVVIWRYKVDPDHVSNFLDLYGQNGEWVRWFGESADYASTELLRSANADHEYITIDRWNSKAAYDQFYEQGKARFDELDALGDEMTLKEELLGSFVG